MASDPCGSIPKQQRNWKQTKGAYRLFDHQRATFQAISRSHWSQTRSFAAAAGVVLWIQDTTWLDYSRHPNTQGLGWHGGPGHEHDQGLLLHSVLAVEPAGGGARVIGLGHGKLWVRAGEAKNQTAAARSARRRAGDRESLRWSEAVGQIGCAPAGSRWLHVGDRESDMFDLYEQTGKLSGVGFVIRVCRDRNADPGHGTADTCSMRDPRTTRLKEVLQAMAPLGQTRLWIAPRSGKTGRWARLNISAGAVTIWSPAHLRRRRALRCWAVRVWEADAPAGIEPIEWILLSSEPANELSEALRMVEYYSLRWMIEEYHQCLKSGCKVEQRQLESLSRLSSLIGMLCIVAVRLLQMKHHARVAPDEPASQCAPQDLIETLSRISGIRTQDFTARRFTHEVAKLGGFLGRKSDGEPGWKTLWLGWQELNLIHAGRQLMLQEQRCG